ncbi:MAG TPA: peptidoglycan-binding protein [Caulobacteraceae bacterium]|nr:peptidoglycan-binding protein [Caulobacteraceae bacterium]
MTLGEWLNQMILEDAGAPEAEPVQRLGASVSPQALSTAYAAPRRSMQPEPEAGLMRADEVSRVLNSLERLSARVEAAEHRSTLAISGIDKSVLGMLRRLETTEREQVQVAARFEGALDEARTDQARLAARLRRVEQEATGHRSAEAMRALESALNKVAGHLYEGETRTREAIDVLRVDLDQIAQKALAADSASQNLVDEVVARIAGRLEQAEAGATSAISSLESSFASLESRLRETEAKLDPSVAAEKFEQLAEDLSRQVEQVRLDMAERASLTTFAGGDDRIDQLDQTVRDMAAQVALSEQRQTHTIEKIGRDVLLIADSFNQKLQEAEHRNSGAIDQLGADVQRMASTVEQKLHRADASQAEALEKLGSEITRITERLSERIANAERRSAQAMDDVGEHVARVSERINQRHEKTSSELLDRMRQSEERTARLLDEARARIDKRLSQVARSVEAEPEALEPAAFDAAPFPVAEPVVEPIEPEAAGPIIHDPFAGTPFAAGYDPFAESQAAEAAFGDQRAEPVAEPAVFHAESTRSIETAFGDVAFEAPDFIARAFDEPAEPMAFPAEPEAFDEPLVLSDHEGFGANATFDDPSAFAADFPAEPEPPAFADEDFDAAHVFAETALVHEAPVHQAPVHETSAHEAPAFDAPFGHSIGEPAPEPAAFDAAALRGASTRELIAAARAAARQASQPPEKERKERGGPLARFGKKREHHSVRNAMLASGAVALLGMSAAAYVLYRPDMISGWAKGDADKANTTPAQTTPAASSVPLAANLTTGPATGSPDVGADDASSLAPVTADQSEAYNQAKDKIKANDPSGVDLMRKTADQGYAPAEFYMAKLYEDGEAGIKKDMVEARRWTQRAADAGDPKAMHNLGLYYFHGDGGTKNVGLAASWFRRAADLGLVDSQYNLAQLYEEGLGVGQNPAEAYKWFLIAAKSGDGESKASADRLKPELSASAQQAAERAAAGFRAESAAPATAAAAPGPDANLAMAQQALSKLGYYKGPTDGANSPALHLAIASYQKTLGQTPDGVLNPDLLSKFGAITAKSGSPG